MKNPYLLTHILSHLHSAVRLFGPDGDLLEEAISEDFHLNIHDWPEILAHPLIRSYNSTCPLLFSVNEALAYAWISIDCGYCLLGPIQLTEKVDFRHKVTLPLRTDGETQAAWEESVPCCSISVFVEDILLLYHLESQLPEGVPPLDSHRLLAASCTYEQVRHQALKEFYTTVFENVENGFAHNPYNHEVRECACIRRGDVEGLRRVLSEAFPGRYGKLAENPIRQAINLGIVTITLASRAAIEGGLHYETSFYLSDVFIRKMEACHDIITIESLYRNAELQYAQLVRELLTQKEGNMPVTENRHISHCKDYIFAHLYKKLTVQEIASAIGLEANYLSALFRKCENVSLKQFILHEKIEMAKNLLVYSDYSYAHIATSLGFSSQSHMGAEFKKVIGMTPRAYRIANSKDDFVQESMELAEKADS